MESPGGPDESFEDSSLLISNDDFSILEKDHKKSELTLLKSLESAWNVIKSGVLIPDSLKGNQYTRPVLILVAALFIVLPIKIYVLVLLIGLIAGVILNPAFDQSSPTVAAYRRKFDQIDAVSFDLVRCPSFSAVTSSSVARLSLSSKIDAALDVFLDRLVTSLIDPWFMQQNKSGQREFQSCVRTTLDAALANLRTTIGGLGKDSTTLFMYGLTNALNIHMQEYKAFCKTKMASKDFLLSSEALRTFYPTTPAEVSHFRQIVSVLLKKLLPRQEAKSIVVISLLKEVIASGALWNAMDRLCDPDFINMKIVEALKEPTDLSTKLEPGWSLVILKVIKGKDLPMDGADGGMYCLIHIAGRKVRTRRISSSNSPVWNESFQFKVSDQVLKHLKLHVQLLKYSYVGQDTNYGYAKVDPEVVKGPEGAKQSWLKFKAGEVFVESYILTSSDGKQPLAPTHEPNDSSVSLPQFEKEIKAKEPVREDITIDEVLRNNEIFMEFYEFLNEFKAPPYLQFFMNYDAFRQFAAMELGVDPNLPEAIDNYFKYHSLTSSQREQLKMIKMDALDLFNRHFLNSENSKYFIDINEDLLRRLQADLKSSDRLSEDGHYAGTGPIGPNMFLPVYNWMYGVLREVYLEKFKASPRFQRYCERSQYSSMSKFTFEEDQVSVMSVGNTLQSKQTVDGDDASLFDVEDGGTVCDDAEMDIKKISTAISILKQQLAVIEDKLESGADSSSLAKLLRTKKEIEKQVESMVNLIRAKESSMANDGDDFWLDLRNVIIKVRPSAHGNDSTSSLWSSNPVYDVEVVRQIDGSSEPLVLSVVSKAFSDFEALHRALKKEFPKLAKIDPPILSDPSESLERYLLLLISDEFVRQSPVLREFVSLDGDLEAKTLTSSASNLVEAVAGKKVKSALQTATSILSLGMIGSGSSSSKAKRSHFYETREHHTTSELLEREPGIESELNRSRSISSLVQEETTGKEKPVCPPLNKSMPPTPVKPSAKLDATPIPKASKLVLESEPKSPQIFSVEEFTEAEMDMLMETVYAFVTETFDLREPNQWIRRKVLSVSKQLLKQAYGDTLSKTMSRTLNGGLTEDGVLKAIEALTRLLWPNGIFIKDVPPPNRSPDQQLATQIEARALFLNKIPDAIEKMAGHYNAVNGMTRIFNMLQEKDFNKLLFLTFIDITTKILFTEQAS